MPKKYATDEDKNFDDLVDRLQRNVYGRLKGEIRLAVIERDLLPFIETPCRQTKPTVIDAGGGQGQFALRLAKAGHQVTLCDISEKMLELAKRSAADQDITGVNFVHGPLQTLASNHTPPADLVLCHAVLEWLADPALAIAHLQQLMSPDGILSLAFFNRNAIVYKNLLRGNYYKVESDEFVGMEGSLTPLHHFKIEEVQAWCEAAGLEVLDVSGIRVFHDYITDKSVRNRHPDAVVAMELKFSKQEPFRSLGRYLHLVLKKRS